MPRNAVNAYGVWLIHRSNSESPYSQENNYNPNDKDREANVEPGRANSQRQEDAINKQAKVYDKPE